MHIETQQNDNVLQEDTMRMEGKHFTAISLNFMFLSYPSLKDLSCKTVNYCIGLNFSEEKARRILKVWQRKMNI